MTSAAAPAWFLRHTDGEVHGPYLLDQIILAAVQGNVATDTEVRHEKHTQNQWIRASRIKQIATAMQSPPPLQPPTIDRTPKQANPAEGWQPNNEATAGSTAVDTDPYFHRIHSPQSPAETNDRAADVGRRVLRDLRLSLSVFCHAMDRPGPMGNLRFDRADADGPGSVRDGRFADT